MHPIELLNLTIMLIPISIVGYFYYLWTGRAIEVAWATLRMIGQLLLIGFILTWLFANDTWLFGVGIVIFMIAVSSWIVMRSTLLQTLTHFVKITAAIALAGTIHLILVLYVVIDLEPLYQPKYVIPIAGMIYANTMNVLALFIERYESELNQYDHAHARTAAFKAAMIPQVNAFLAVGLVSLPGMMTGQILSGIDPLVAVRYQIVVMAMIFGSAGMGIIFYDTFCKRQNWDS